MSKSHKDPVEELFRRIKERYVLVGKSRVRSWHIWLVLGLVVGAIVGILYVANRSNEFLTSEASSAVAGLSEANAALARNLTIELTQLNEQAETLASNPNDPAFDAVLRQMRSLIKPLKRALRMNKKVEKLANDITPLISEAMRPRNTTEQVLVYLGRIDDQLEKLTDVLSLLTMSPTATSQPNPTLAPHSAIVPFTAITLSPKAPLYLNAITIERTGLANNAAFKKVVLMTATPDPDAGSNYIVLSGDIDPAAHTAVLTNSTGGIYIDTPTNFIVAGVMADDLSPYAGQVAYLDVVSAIFSQDGGSLMSLVLPRAIHGTGQTFNNSLQIGSVTAAYQNLPDASGTQKRFLILSNSSVEDVVLNNMVEAGSDGAVIVDGRSYECSSLDGWNMRMLCYFKEALLIPKGESLEIQTDRTFDNWQGFANINIVGRTYGYQIPVSYVPQVSLRVTHGPIPAILPNLMPGVSNQTIGMFTVNVSGEPISVNSIKFNIAIDAAPGSVVQGVTLQDAEGATVAGPKDVANGTLVFTDQVVFPLGTNVYSLKAKIASTIPLGTKVTALTWPSTDWLGATGVESGLPVSPLPDSLITWSTLTAGDFGSLMVSPDLTLSAKQIIAGEFSVEVGRFRLDASKSSDDITLGMIEANLFSSNNFDPDALSNIQLFDGSQALTTGVNIVNLAGHSANENIILRFTLDQRLRVSKGTIKNISIRANMGTNAQAGGGFTLSPFETRIGSWGVVGASSGLQINPSFDYTTGSMMTVVRQGGLSVSLDPSFPLERWVVGGSSNVALLPIRIRAINEDIALTELRLRLRAPASANDIMAISLWNGATQIARKVSPAFTSGIEDFVLMTNGDATFIVPKDNLRVLTVKVDFSPIGAFAPGTAGRLVAIDVFANDTPHWKGLGVGSGVMILASIDGDITSSGVRYFRSLPMVERLSIPVTTLTSGNNVLYKFQVRADPAYDVALRRFVFKISLTGAGAENFILRDVTDSNRRVAASAVISAGPAGEMGVAIVADTTDYPNPWVTIPASQTHMFELRADTTTDGLADSITTRLLGDAAYSILSTPMGSAIVVEDDTNNNFIWSDYSGDVSGTHSLTSRDWTNGYKVPGLLSIGLNASTLSN